MAKDPKNEKAKKDLDEAREKRKTQESELKKDLFETLRSIGKVCISGANYGSAVEHERQLSKNYNGFG